MADTDDLPLRVKDVFICAYKRNCQIEDSEVTAEDEAALSVLSPSQSLDCLRELLERLLGEKKEQRTEEGFEVQMRCQQFERMLQKLEGEVRTHIRVQQQLKLQLEAAQEKVEAYQRAENSLPATQADDPSPPRADSCMKEPCIRPSHHRFPSEIAPLLSHPPTSSLKKSKSSLHLPLDHKKRELLYIKSERKHAIPKESVPRRTIFDRPSSLLQTDRLIPLKAANTDRKGGFSPYRLNGAMRSLSKFRLEVGQNDGKRQARVMAEGKKSVGRGLKA